MVGASHHHRQRSTTFISLVLIVELAAGFLAPSHASNMAPSKANYANSPAMRLPEAELLASIEYEADADDDNEAFIRSVPAVMSYVTQDTQLIQLKRNIDGSDTGFQGAEWESRTVRIYNAAGKFTTNHRPTLHQQGFELQHHPIPQRGLDFLDTQQVVDHYYPDCERFLKQFLGDKVAVVKAFDHNVRIQDAQGPVPLKNTGDIKSTTQQPIGVVHGDYTMISAPQRLKYFAEPPKLNDVLRSRLCVPGQAPRSLLDPVMVQEAIEGKRRFSLINVWRSIDPVHPVEQMPLACLDAATVQKKDFRTVQLHYADRIGENYFICYPNEQQQQQQDENDEDVDKKERQHVWNYFRGMTFDDVILLKQWDSHGGLARGLDRDTPSYPSTFSFHAAFCDPSSPTNAAPRKSIETRCVILWELNDEEGGVENGKDDEPQVEQ